jgi:hypothetical protein
MPNAYEVLPPATHPELDATPLLFTIIVYGVKEKFIFCDAINSTYSLQLSVPAGFAKTSLIIKPGFWALELNKNNVIKMVNAFFIC